MKLLLAIAARPAAVREGLRRGKRRHIIARALAGGGRYTLVLRWDGRGAELVDVRRGWRG